MAAAREFLQANSSTTDLTTYTFSAQNLGAESADRFIVVCAQARKGSSQPTLASVTVGGVSASIVAATPNQTLNAAGIAIAAVPTGATGDVVVTWSEAMLRCGIQMYRVTGIDSATAHDSGNSQVADPTTSLDIPAGGVAIGCACWGSSSTTTWTGLTEDHDGVVESNLTCTSASGEFASLQTGLTVTADSGSTTNPCGAFASWAPASGDVTPPTLGTLAVPSAGTTLTGTLSESGCIPTSGTGGFTLGGTSATVASWAISGTTLTLTLTGTVLSGETVTLSYDDATTTDDITDAATNKLADITDAAVTNNSTQTAALAAGTASFVSSGPAGISVSATDATGGTAPYTYQWERNEDGGAFGDLTGETALTCDDATATTPGILYGYRLKYTDDVAAEVTSNTVTAQVYSGGLLGGVILPASSDMNGGF